MNQTDQTREFVLLWTQSARRIFGFILTLLPNWSDAEEVLQETSALLWEKFDQYRPGTDFRAWACRVAYLKVQERRRGKAKEPHLFSQELVDVIDQTLEQENEAIFGRGAALADCVQKLRPQARELIRQRYAPRATVQSVAAELGRSVDAVYKALNRIHDELFNCVERTLAEDRSK